MKFLKDIFKDVLEQSWTLLGLVIGFIVLEGTAKTLTGWLIVTTLTVWVLSFPIRQRED